MRIAQFAPLAEAVPPLRYGGTERVVSYLTEELVRLGHDVVLFASGDSRTTANLVACCPAAVRVPAHATNPTRAMLSMLSKMLPRLEQFDILHFHTDILRHSVFHSVRNRSLTTMHGQPEDPDSVDPDFYRVCPTAPLVSVSRHQQLSAPGRNWVANVYHGMPRNLLKLYTGPREEYLAFLGRISPKKGPDVAIEIARRCRLRLKIAAKVDDADRGYFNSRVRPLIDGFNVEFLGELDNAGKAELLRKARALLFPINWPEAFGLAMIEAMACGTPVVALACGSVPEIVEPGLTGFVVTTISDAVAAVALAGRCDPVRIRDRFERRFSSTRMARDYADIYASLANKAATQLPSPS